jgi:hypothetical protein
MKTTITLLVILWVILAFFTAWIAGTKGRSEGAWFVLGLLFGIIALLAVGLASSPEPEGNHMRPEPSIPPEATPWDPRKGPPPWESS